MELSIPNILGPLIFSLLEFGTLEEFIHILTTFRVFLTTFIVFYLSMSTFLSSIKKLVYMPFIVYGLVLGITILWLI